MSETHPRTTVPLMPAPARNGPARTAWMVTFTDLVALMLTFFVLLFSMSQIEQQKWQSIVNSLASNLTAIQRVPTAKIAADYQVAADIVPPGADLDYLEPILRAQLASDPLLADASIGQTADGLNISFPGARIFTGHSADASAEGENIIAALGGVLQNLHNAIDVNTRIAAGEGNSGQNWQNALARSLTVVRILTKSGFTGPIVARGLGGGAPDDSAAGQGGAVDSIDILVRATERTLP